MGRVGGSREFRNELVYWYGLRIFSVLPRLKGNRKNIEHFSFSEVYNRIQIFLVEVNLPGWMFVEGRGFFYRILKLRRNLAGLAQWSLPDLASQKILRRPKMGSSGWQKCWYRIIGIGSLRVIRKNPRNPKVTNKTNHSAKKRHPPGQPKTMPAQPITTQKTKPATPAQTIAPPWSRSCRSLSGVRGRFCLFPRRLGPAGIFAGSSLFPFPGWRSLFPVC